MENNNFSYTYSAKQQDEVSKIRDKYISKEEDKMETLRRLDRNVTVKATVLSLTVGIAGTLVMGMGMSLVMSDFSSILGDYEKYSSIIGIIIGIIGLLLGCTAYPIYKKSVAIERNKIAPEIIRISDEIMGNR